MSVRQRGLGRGLGALIAPAELGQQRAPVARPSDVFFNSPASTGTADPAGVGTVSLPSPAPAQPEDAAGGQLHGQVVGELRLVPVGAIVPNPRQPRTAFDEDALEELAASIREVGVLQPVVVRNVGQDRYELIMGERRWRASQLAERSEIPAVIRSTSDDELLREALIENLHRSELNALEEAAAYAQLLNDFGCTHEQLAGRLGRSRSHISNTLRLLGLSPTVQRRVAAGILSAGHARALLAVEDTATQEALAARVVAEGLSVRAVEELVAVSQPAKRPRSRPTPNTPPELSDIAAELTDRLDTRVKVSMGRSKGRITVEFAGVDDLQRIVDAIRTSAGAAAT